MTTIRCPGGRELCAIHKDLHDMQAEGVCVHRAGRHDGLHHADFHGSRCECRALNIESNTYEGFDRSDGPDHSVLRCPCGADFLWCGVAEGLRPWIAEHTPHLTEIPAKQPSKHTAAAMRAARSISFEYCQSASGRITALTPHFHTSALASLIDAEFRPAVEALEAITRHGGWWEKSRAGHALRQIKGD